MGHRVTGPTKSEAGKRLLVLPAFLHTDLRRHLDWFAEKKPDGLLFVGERGAPFRRTTFGRKWHKARVRVGMPDGFRFYDLRHTGHTLSTQSGATLKDTMVRAGQSSERAALSISTRRWSDREKSPAALTHWYAPTGRRSRTKRATGLLVRIWCKTLREV